MRTLVGISVWYLKLLKNNWTHCTTTLIIHKDNFYLLILVAGIAIYADFGRLWLFIISSGLLNHKTHLEKRAFDSYSLTSKQWNAEILILDIITSLVYILKIPAHLDQYSLNSSIFPAALILSRERDFFFFENVCYSPSKTVFS